MRLSSAESICERGIGFCPDPGTFICWDGDFFPVATVSSTIVFHSPHAGQRPIHLGLSLPHALQNHTVFVFAVAILHSCQIYFLDSHNILERHDLFINSSLKGHLNLILLGRDIVMSDAIGIAAFITISPKNASRDNGT